MVLSVDGVDWSVDWGVDGSVDWSMDWGMDRGVVWGRLIGGAWVSHTLVLDVGDIAAIAVGVGGVVDNLGAAIRKSDSV